MRRLSVIIAGILLAIPASPAFAESKAPPAVRTTIGAVRVKGWESDLVHSDPNLGNWYWSPITNYIQGGPTQRTGKGAQAALTIVRRPASKYISNSNPHTNSFGRAERTSPHGRTAAGMHAQTAVLSYASYSSSSLSSDFSSASGSLSHADLQGRIISHSACAAKPARALKAVAGAL